MRISIHIYIYMTGAVIMNSWSQPPIAYDHGCRKRLPTAVPAVGNLLRQPWSRQLATDEIKLSKLQCQGITPSYQSASQAWQH